MQDLLKQISDAALSRLIKGDDPNDIISDFADAVEDVVDERAPLLGWCKWGDGNWRQESACSICGSSVPGICGHQNDPKQKVYRGVEAQQFRATLASVIVK